MTIREIQTMSGSITGSTIPLDKFPCDEKSSDYDPFTQRNVAHPTT